MDWTEVLNIIGNIASIITVIGGVYGLVKWIKSREAKIKVVRYEKDSPFYYVFLYNEGSADADNVRISAASKYNIETSAYIPKILPSEDGQLSFCLRQPVPSLPIKIHWTDGMGRHCKRVNIKPSMHIK